MDTLSADLRYTFRSVRARPGLALVGRLDRRRDRRDDVRVQRRRRADQAADALIRRPPPGVHAERSVEIGRTDDGSGFDVRRGEFLKVMGPSGSGMSTLLNVLGMPDGEWRGTYRLLGHPVDELRPRARLDLGRRHIGFVFQEFHLLEDMTVYENLEVPLSYRDVARRDREAIVADALDRFGIVAKKGLLRAEPRRDDGRPGDARRGAREARRPCGAPAGRLARLDP